MSSEQESCAPGQRGRDRDAAYAVRVQHLNDEFRRTGEGGRLLVTPGVLALGSRAYPSILRAVREFTAFTPGNDPHNEHDFGSFAWNRHKVFWKIDYYDRDVVQGSPDPSDPSVTTRVLTVMLASEY